jgi:hypothetical protein
MNFAKTGLSPTTPPADSSSSDTCSSTAAPRFLPEVNCDAVAEALALAEEVEGIAYEKEKYINFIRNLATCRHDIKTLGTLITMIIDLRRVSSEAQNQQPFHR